MCACIRGMESFLPFQHFPHTLIPSSLPFPPFPHIVHYLPATLVPLHPFFLSSFLSSLSPSTHFISSHHLLPLLSPHNPSSHPHPPSPPLSPFPSYPLQSPRLTRKPSGCVAGVLRQNRLGQSEGQALAKLHSEDYNEEETA